MSSRARSSAASRTNDRHGGATFRRQGGTVSDRAPYLPAVWIGPDGEPVACVEKLDVLRQNLAELREMAQEALEDAVVMGCDEAQAREVLSALVASLDPPFS